MTLISLCMIVKNEEKLLSRCLESVKDLVDEIIIVDTGSEDSTKLIARQYTDHVYDFEWNHDFSAARNESLRYAKGKWILVLDADEYVQDSDHEQLRLYLSKYKDKAPSGFIVNIMNFTGSGYDETKMTESTGARLFKNHSKIRYTEPLHEQLVSNLGEIHYTPISFTIFHSGYTKEIVEQKNKSERNMAILKTMKSKNRNDSYYYFVLGNEYSNTGETKSALNSYQCSYKDVKPTDSWYHHLLDRLITTEMQEGLYHLANTHIQAGIQSRPHHTDYYCLKGILLDSLGYWNAAAKEFEKCIQIATQAEQKNTPYWIVQPTHGKIIPYQILGDIHRKKGDLTSAVQFWVKALYLQPKNFIILRQMVDHLLAIESPEQVEIILEMIYPVAVPMNSILLFKIALHTGNKHLITKYQEWLQKLGIELKLEDLLLYNLSNQAGFPRIDITKSEKVAPHIAVMASIVYNNAELTGMIANDDLHACEILARTALLCLQNKEMDLELIEGHEPLLFHTLLLLWKYDYKEIYFTLLQGMANAETLNLLGNSFYLTGQMEQALELFSLLLEHQLLGADGFKFVGQWYINMRELAEGYKFIEASLSKEPSVELLGIITENYPYKERATLLNSLYTNYPHLENTRII